MDMDTYPLYKPGYILFHMILLLQWVMPGYEDEYEYEQDGKFQFWPNYTYCFFFTWYLLGDL